MVAARYRIRERIFSGRGWSSYLALDTDLGAEVELDLVSASPEELPVEPQRLREILRAAQGIRGPRVLPLLNWGEEGDYFYLVREKGEGTPLPELISQLALPEAQVVELAAAAVEVLAEAYGTGLYYLGLNPGQVLVDRRGSLRFQRVGYGWILEDMDPAQAARVSPYRAPETEPGKEGTRASDVFSLAVMVDEVLPEGSRTEKLELLLQRAGHPLPGRRPSSPRLVLEELENSLRSPAGGGGLAPDEVEFPPGGWRGGEPEGAEPFLDDGEGEVGSSVNRGARSGERRLRGWAGKLALMFAGGLVLWVVFSALSGFLGARRERRSSEEEGPAGAWVEVPDLQGFTLEEARERLEEFGLTWSLRESPSRLWSAGRVVAQDPAAGSELHPGETICLVISSGREEPSIGPEESQGSPGEVPTVGEDEWVSHDVSAAPPRATSPASAGASRSASRPPRAVAFLSALRGPAPLYVRMDAGGSSDPDGDIVGYVWHCGDGTMLHGKTVQHVYDPPVIPARFRVVLEVFDSRGLSDSAALTVEVY
ncbi:PASTA domain-containing protein [Candidatus Solincola sp.]